MKTNIKKISCIIMFGIIILMANFAHSGAPEGRWESIPPGVQKEVLNGLRQEGLCPNCDLFTDRLIIEGKITTYLWDNRNLLTMEPIPKHREVDVLLCLMRRKGNTISYFFFDSFTEFCSIHIRGVFQDTNSPDLGPLNR